LAFEFSFPGYRFCAPLKTEIPGEQAGDLEGKPLQISHPGYPGRWVVRSYWIFSLPVK
jgi:hypothetical protein